MESLPFTNLTNLEIQNLLYFHSLEEFREALDFLWALYEHYSDQGITVIIGDFNGALDFLGGNRICS